MIVGERNLVQRSTAGFQTLEIRPSPREGDVHLDGALFEPGGKISQLAFPPAAFQCRDAMQDFHQHSLKTNVVAPSRLGRGQEPAVPWCAAIAATQSREGS